MTRRFRTGRNRLLSAKYTVSFFKVLDFPRIRVKVLPVSASMQINSEPNLASDSGVNRELHVSFAI